jgi:dienelactone hydrolase
MPAKSLAPMKAAILHFYGRNEWEMLMKTESVKYSIGSLGCRGALIWDENADTKQPLLLMAPNWLGVVDAAIELGKWLAGEGYVVFVADMFGEGKAPKGDENPMEFLGPLIADAAETRRRIVAAFETMTMEAATRHIGDVKRRAAIGYCFGGHNVLDLARAGADVQAVVSVHGVLATPMPAQKGDIKAAVLVLHGAADPISPKAHRDLFEAEMDAAGARWYELIFGNVVHAYTIPGADFPPVAKYDEPATRHGYTLAHAFIADSFAGKL